MRGLEIMILKLFETSLEARRNENYKLRAELTLLITAR
jgi:hypothetical protein